MRARRIPKDLLGEISGEEWIDRNRRPYIEGDTAWIPVREGMAFDREIPVQPRYRGRGYYMAGDVAILQGKKPSPEDIRKIVAEKNPRGIVWREALLDITRIPRTEVVFGECGEVRHRESGYTYIFDPVKVMFSQGNRNEKMRIADLIQSGCGKKRVADMFAGIGYFSIPMAGAGADVHAMEINPVAFGYLERNVRENHLSKRITPAHGDCRRLLSGTYDRIVMGHFDAIGILPDALKHSSHGTCIHLHSIGPCEERIKTCVEGAGFSCGIEVHKVKKYRPHAWHVVHDIVLL